MHTLGTCVMLCTLVVSSTILMPPLEMVSVILFLPFLCSSSSRYITHVLCTQHHTHVLTHAHIRMHANMHTHKHTPHIQTDRHTYHIYRQTDGIRIVNNGKSSYTCYCKVPTMHGQSCISSVQKIQYGDQLYNSDMNYLQTIHTSNWQLTLQVTMSYLLQQFNLQVTTLIL